jgi:hypothetical protein
MKRVGGVAAIVLILVTVLTSSTLAARPAPEFVARAGANVPGRGLPVMARVVNARWGVPFRATAVVHFQTGDVEVRMWRLWPWHVALGRVRIPENEPYGPVRVDVTIRYGAMTTTIRVEGTVLDPDPNDEEESPPEEPPQQET